MKRTQKYIILIVLLLGLRWLCFGQVPINGQPTQTLPPAPVPQTAPTQITPPTSVQPSAPQNPGAPMFLTLKQAEAFAIKNNPQISVA